MNSSLKKPEVERGYMTDKELIDCIYDRCPDAKDHPYTIDQYFDRCQDIIDMIDAHKKGLDVAPCWRQDQAGLDY